MSSSWLIPTVVHICHLAKYSMAHPNKVIYTQRTEASPFLWHRNLKTSVAFYPGSQGPSSFIKILPRILTAFGPKPK